LEQQFARKLNTLFVLSWYKQRRRYGERFWGRLWLIAGAEAVLLTPAGAATRALSSALRGAFV